MTRNKLIIKLKNNGISFGELAKEFDVSRQRIEQITTQRKNISNSIRNYIYKRDSFCQWCGFFDGLNTDGSFKNDNFVIHHIDLDPSNNNKENLILLCKKCHRKFHKLQNKFITCSHCKKNDNPCSLNQKYGYICKECLKKIVEENKKKWSIKFDKCVVCGKNDIKHHSFGMCYNCYSKNKYKTNEEWRKKQDERTKKWRKKNPEKLKIINSKASKKYYMKKRAFKIANDKYNTTQ